MKSKRGQIAVFIILGFIIIFSVGFVLYIKGRTSDIKPSPVIPQNIVPIQEYIEGCAENYAREAIELAGQNGGFVEIPEVISKDKNSYLDFAPGIDSIRMPLWYYEGRNRMPSETFITDQIEEYVESNIDECINNFQGFEDQFIITEKEKLSAEVTLAEESVIIDINYPLEINDKLNQKSTEWEDFSTSIPIRLKKILELAYEIFDDENTDMHLEDFTIDLIAMDPDIPYSGMAISCKRKEWPISSVKSRLKDIITVNIPFLRVNRTDYTPLPDTLPYAKNHYVLPMTGAYYKGMHASFTYEDDWPMMLNIRPSDGKTLKSNAQSNQKWWSFLCIHMWHFTYDVVYPVMVTLTDDKTEAHEAFAFRYAFEVSVNHNQGDRSNFGLSDFELEERPSSERYCEETKENTITVVTENEFTGMPIGKVNLTYTCFNYLCNIGETMWVSNGAETRLRTEFPYCINGILKGNARGYQEAEMFLSTDFDKVVTLTLKPNKMISTYSVVKHMEGGNEQPLAADETAVIRIISDDIESQGIYPLEGPDAEYPLEFMAMQDMDYEIEIYLIKNGTMVGGYIGNWTLAWDELKNAQSILFHVYAEEIEDEDDEMVLLTDLAELSDYVPKPELAG